MTICLLSQPDSKSALMSITAARLSGQQGLAEGAGYKDQQTRAHTKLLFMVKLSSLFFLPPLSTFLCKQEATEWKSASMQSTHRLTPDGRQSAAHSNQHWQKTSGAFKVRGDFVGLPARGGRV